MIYTTYNLKSDPEDFQAVYDNLKTYEIRRYERDFQVGDHLVLLELKEPEKEGRYEFTGRCLEVEVTHILRGPIYGLKEAWVIMSIEKA
jgi:hypothetical protein